jgi:hypothetical protein
MTIIKLVSSLIVACLVLGTPLISKAQEKTRTSSASSAAETSKTPAKKEDPDTAAKARAEKERNTAQVEGLAPPLTGQTAGPAQTMEGSAGTTPKPRVPVATPKGATTATTTATATTTTKEAKK